MVPLGKRNLENRASKYAGWRSLLRREDRIELHLRNGCLSWRPAKTAQTTGIRLTVRELPELQAALDAMPKSDALTFILTEHGRLFASSAAFGNRFADC